MTTDEALLGLPETISVATGRAQSIRTAPAVATLITADEIRNYGARNVREALRLVPGMHIGTVATYGARVGVRGFTAQGNLNILFMIDGVPQSVAIFDEQFGALGSIPIDIVERIEVTRGPGSVVFGADAFSAVVNVITIKTPGQNRIVAAGGSWDTAEGRALGSFSANGVDGVIGLTGMSTSGFSPYFGVDNQSIYDAQMGTDASFAPGFGDTSRRELGALLNLSYGNTAAMLRYSRFYDMSMAAGLAGNLDPFGKQEFDTYEARVSHDFALADDFALKLTADAKKSSWLLHNVMYLGPGAFGAFRDGAFQSVDSDQETLRLEADARYDGFANHSVAFGVGYQTQTDSFRDESINYIISGPMLMPAPAAIDPRTPAISSRILYTYVQDEWDFLPRWSLTYGARVDEYSEFGTQISPRAALVWTPDPLWTVKLLYGQGFRPPSLMESRSYPIPVFVANPDLEPEKLRSVDLAIGFAPTSKLDFQLNLYRHETVDQIRQQDFGAFYKPENVGDQRGQGGELEMNWAITPQLSFYGWYAYQWNNDITTGENAGYSPQHRFFGSLQYTIGKAFFNLQGFYVGDRARVAEDWREEPDEYGQLGLLSRYQFTKALSLELDVRNLLNQQSYEPGPGTTFPIDYPLPERNYYLTMRVDF
ncbi:MAG: TonB-dependent receptor [Gammaproteobacteria bacterium]|nr:TonB-dependent receptor [Gammaproteobacteria bacterium]